MSPAVAAFINKINLISVKGIRASSIYLRLKLESAISYVNQGWPLDILHYPVFGQLLGD